jgi:hypothetical protein
MGQEAGEGHSQYGRCGVNGHDPVGSVGIVARPEARVRLPAGTANGCCLHSDQITLRMHRTFYTKVTVYSFTGVNWPKREADHWFLCSAVVNNVELYLHSSILLHGAILI